MSQSDSSEEQLDFAAPASATVALPTCANCGREVAGEYWSVGSAVVCGRCKVALQESQQSTGGIVGRGGRFSRALLLGIGGMILGAALWYAVAKFANLEIGLIAIVLGWLVAKGILKGSGDRGGRRYQVMAVILTYLGIGLSYLPFMFEDAPADASASAVADSLAGAGAAGDSFRVAAPADSVTVAAATEAGDSVAVTDEAPTGLLTVAGAFLFLVVALPVLVIQGGFPGSLISVLIYGFALLQAWRMTAERELDIRGPFQVGGPGSA